MRISEECFLFAEFSNMWPNLDCVSNIFLNIFLFLKLIEFSTLFPVIVSLEIFQMSGQKKSYVQYRDFDWLLFSQIGKQWLVVAVYVETET